jgi:hypothetical protein
MDEADLTNERLEAENAALIARARLRAARSGFLYTGCRHCDEPLEDARRTSGFCSAECRDDFEKFEAALSRMGQSPAV